MSDFLNLKNIKTRKDDTTQKNNKIISGRDIIGQQYKYSTSSAKAKTICQLQKDTIVCNY